MNTWIKNITEDRHPRPEYDCEVFVIAEVLEDHKGFKKGEIFMQTDWYNAEEDSFSDCDRQELRALWWQEILYPAPPEEISGEIDILIHTVSRSISFPKKKKS